MTRQVPPDRLRIVNSKPSRAEGTFVLCWMTAFRRAQDALWNAAHASLSAAC